MKRFSHILTCIVIFTFAAICIFAHTKDTEDTINVRFANGDVRSYIANGIKSISNTIDKMTITHKDGTTESYAVADVAKVEFDFTQRDYEAEERAALIAFYNAAGGDNWINNDNWCTDKPLDEWYGIQVDEGRVKNIELPYNALKGDIGNMIHALLPLTELEGIWLQDNNNYVNGEFPEDFYRFTKLTSIYIGYNLEGELTEDISQLNALRFIDLNGVKISPTILKKICCSLTNLRVLSLINCKINGTIPEEIENLKNLHTLRIYSSDLNGTIPEEIWTLPISSLGLSHNPNLTGSISAKIQNLENLSFLSLERCSLTGSIPNEICECTNLSDVFLHENKLEGELPKDIGNLTKLTLLNLQNNNLTGTLPVSMSKLQNLSECFLYGNRLSGDVPKEVCEIWDKWSPLSKIIPQQEGYVLNYLSTYESTDFSKDGEVVQLQKHSVGNGITTILLGDAFVDKDMSDGGKYEQAMKRAMEAYFSTEPMSSLRNMFDVYYVRCVSTNEYIGGKTALNTYQGNCLGIDDNKPSDLSKCLEYASKVQNDLKDTQIHVVLNDQQQAGVTHFLADKTTVSVTSMFDREGELQNFEAVFRHEAIGHGLGLLLDEYDHAGTVTEDFKESIHSLHTRGYGLNVDVTNDSTNILWSKFLFDERYKDEDIGIYEGAGAHYDKGIYRPSYNSIMRFNKPIFNAPSREAIYKRAMKLAYGNSWTYDYETFVQWDMAHYPKATITRSVTQMENSDLMKNHRPPVIINRTSEEILKSSE